MPEPFRGIVTEADYRANLDAAAPSFEASILTGDQVSYMAGSPCAGSLIAFQNAMAKGRSTYAPLIAVINAAMRPPPVGYTPGEEITGCVTQIPVALNTIGSVTFDPATVKGATVTNGATRLGGFLYGGSLNILLFSKGIASPAVQTRLGNQIAILNAGDAPELFSPR